MVEKDNLTYAVFGANGFLGGSLYKRLIAEGKKVIGCDIRKPQNIPESEEFFEGDVRKSKDVEKICSKADVVFNTVAIIDWTPKKQQLLYDVNVTGNQNIIDACLAHDVKKYLFTSSIDVVFDGTPIKNGNETIPYPKKHLDNYSHSKMLAEIAALNANGKNGMATCSLRTAGMYGPGDRTRLPSVIDFLREGKYMSIGDRKAVFNHVYVENCSYAHVLAAEKLALDSPLAGQAYFITDGDATNFYDFFPPILTQLGYEVPTKSLPLGIAMFIARISETLTKLKGKGSEKPPLLTKYTVTSTARDFSFNHEKATRDFAYEPIVSFQDAQQATVAWLQKNGYGREKHS